MRRIDDPGALPCVGDGAHYLTQFVDFASADGWYPQTADLHPGAAYPYHLAISPHWLVHSWRCRMEDDPARRAEERQFLADPQATLGTSAMAALHAIGQRLGLDYGGIDFSLLADGSVEVSGANATMLVIRSSTAASPTATRRSRRSAISASACRHCVARAASNQSRADRCSSTWRAASLRSQ